MRIDVRDRVASLGLEELEPRLVPSAAPLVQESFDGTAAGALPSGWSQWGSGGSPTFAASPARAFSGPAGLTSTAASNVAARAWVAAPLPSDVQVTAAVFVDSLAPAQVLVRGSNLNTDAPSYYALSVGRGLYAQLVRVVNGASTVLGEVDSAAWFEGQWAQLTLSVTGGRLQAQVYRPDTRQYLTASGQWQSSPAWALDRTDSAIAGGGYAGLARAAGYGGNVSFDSFAVTGNAPAAAPVATVGLTESFDGTPPGSLPAGWSQWSSAAPSFGVSTARAESGPAGLGSAGGSGVAARAWVGSPQAADVQAGAAVFVDGLAPAQVLVRGSNLNTDAPTYYALSVRRGLSLSLVRVVNGVSTTLGEVGSASWLEGQWVELALSATGGRLQAQVYRPDTRQYLDASGRWQSAPAWAFSLTDSAITGAGYAGVGRVAGYAGNVYFDNFSVTPLGGAPAGGGTQSGGGNTQSTAPSIPQHYPWIRLAQLAYSGLALGPTEDQLLRSSIDLVVTDVPYLSDHVSRVAPGTPQLAYTNYTSLYQELLTDWLAYADAHGLARESAFYHVTRATRFSGDSPSSQPVNWFWRVYQGGAWPDFRDVTAQAHLAGSQPFSLGGLGESTYVGYPEKFREINVNLASGAGPGWSGVLEYPTAVDAFGNPTAWGTLRALSDTTAGLRRSGQILFDPPADWKPASLNGTAPLYYVRVRAVGGGAAPLANTLLGRDYVGAGGGTSGVIPAFDYSADVNHDGYLSDAEYARRRPGFDARFAYEGRLFYGIYGQERFAANPSDAGFRAWAVDYSQRYLAAHPLAGGLFVDNSAGDSLVPPGGVLEATSAYANDYGSLLSAIGRAVAPRWLLANTAGGGLGADGVVRQNAAYFEEFALRPLAASYHQFEDTAALFAHRAALQAPAPYAVLDSLPTGGSPADPRTQIATLAYYYLLADPQRTFLDPFGGYEPATAWARHWFGALAYDVGRPAGPWSLFATGADPNDYRFVYRVYQRRYGNALVLYKPLSGTPNGSAVGSLSDNTATTQALGGSYRPLRADGTLGPPVTSVSLRNGEGAVLIRV